MDQDLRPLLGDVPPPPHTQKSGWIKIEDHCWAMYPSTGKTTTIQVDLIQMDDYPADSCAIRPTAFLLISLRICINLQPLSKSETYCAMCENTTTCGTSISIISSITCQLHNQLQLMRSVLHCIIQ